MICWAIHQNKFWFDSLTFPIRFDSVRPVGEQLWMKVFVKHQLKEWTWWKQYCSCLDICYTADTSRSDIISAGLAHKMWSEYEIRMMCGLVICANSDSYRFWIEIHQVLVRESNHESPTSSKCRHLCKLWVVDFCMI